MPATAWKQGHLSQALLSMHVIPAHELLYVLLYCSALVSRDHEYATIHTVPQRLNPVDDTFQLFNRYVTIMFF